MKKNKNSNSELSMRMYIMVDKMIDTMLSKNKKINFMAVHKETGVARSTLYNNQKLKAKISHCREVQLAGAVARNKVDNKNKDVIISALEKKVAKLENTLSKKNAKIVMLEKDIDKLSLILCEGE